MVNSRGDDPLNAYFCFLIFRVFPLEEGSARSHPELLSARSHPDRR